VRQDLCLRHRERHTTNGSQLHKRDVFAQTTSGQSPIAAAPTRGSPTFGRQVSSPTASHKHISPSHSRRSPENYRHSTSKSEESSSVAGTRQSGSTASASTVSVESRFEPPTPHAIYPGPTPTIHRSNSSSSHPLSPHQRQAPSSSISLGRQGSYGSNSELKHEATFYKSAQDGSYDGRPTPLLSPTRTYSSSSQNNHQTQYYNGSPIMTNAGASSHGAPFNQNSRVPAFPINSYPSESSQHTSSASFAAAVSQSLNALNSTSVGPYVTMPDGSLSMDMTAAYSYPIFGGDEYNRSPNALGGDFTAWFFNENQSAALGYPSATAVMPELNDNGVLPFPGPYFPLDSSSISIYPNVAPPQHAMSVLSIVEHYAMSEEKRQELLDLMNMQFNERPHDAVKKRKDAVFEGDVNAENHILSLRMMHTYVGSYWYHQHAQLPILHKPTFTADRTPNLLLLMVIAIGAATLDKAYGTALTDSAAEFANFVVWHVRWEIVRDADFRPPAKLWIFQTLLLIEVYEKMYSTRALHERSHIHHDSTLTLMRRGSSLIGRPAFDSPPSLRDDKTARSSGSNSAIDTPGSEETWARWITNEATRRAAFAAFVIDSIHATMFGHSVRVPRGNCSIVH
jgi:Fungal specific transcription factor domain